ncbi:MIZ/SP-RING zinc finger domain-containing protein [Ditylenchus destructor]|uniref:MIZ/SP-RING zinc finger domain-containing protein n=1 Tax=Ditylenchus destructor TaxID=166010 RepID=A0AAD4MIB4_9BILA|nr:MIZ/SP-RING zinc finger domain-containing protein [Ditylenchus destructor]
MPRYNFRTLRGERITKKKEGKRIKRWELDYDRFINDARNTLSVEAVVEEIAHTLKTNEIEQTKVSLICPLTKERISLPVRYRICRHLQCFDLKGFLAMKSKRNFLVCPICNTRVNNELTGLCIDRYFQKILSKVTGAMEAEILCDGTFKAALSRSALIIPKVIDDEEKFKLVNPTTHICDVKQQTYIYVDDVEEGSSVDIDSEGNASDTETQNSDFSMAGDIILGNKSTIAESSLLKSNSTIVKRPAQFICSQCPAILYESEIIPHISAKHLKYFPFECATCKETNQKHLTVSKEDMDLHMANHHTGNNLGIILLEEQAKEIELYKMLEQCRRLPI